MAFPILMTDLGSIHKHILDKIGIFNPLHVSVMNISDNIRLFQKSHGVRLASCGGEGKVFHS